MDFFVVPTVTFRLLYVLIIMHHDRRKVVHFNITDSPSAAWTAQQSDPTAGGVARSWKHM